MHQPFVRLSSAIALLGLMSGASAAPQLTFNCLNPKMNLQFKQVTEKQAASQPVQFQINWEGKLPPGTINVNYQNNGVCTVGISEGYVLKSGRGSFTANGSYNASDKTKPKDVDKIVNVTFDPQVREGEFTVKSTNNSPVGSVTVVFIVNYEKDQ